MGYLISLLIVAPLAILLFVYLIAAIIAAPFEIIRRKLGPLLERRRMKQRAQAASSGVA